MEEKEKYIKEMLEESIIDADKRIKEGYDSIKEYEELPNDCKGIEIDGEICENPDYKIDALTNFFHQIGYMEGVKKTAQDMLMLNDFSIIEFKEFLIEQEEIEIHNKKVMDDMREYIKTKNPDLLNDDGGIG